MPEGDRKERMETLLRFRLTQGYGSSVPGGDTDTPAKAEMISGCGNFRTAFYHADSL